ncbi:MAG: hypothetical protein COA42_18715 [Alteromonadaceae bacterium]|nr:MAG: hypothetical protein COA42_18715 [Alteromonadaceae bacterium]
MDLPVRADTDITDMDNMLDDSAAKRNIQMLDKSDLYFDFFKKNQNSNTISDEQSLLQALELLEHSASGDATDFTASEQPLYGMPAENSFSLEDIEDELESNVDQLISEEMFDILEENEIYEEEDEVYEE